jgi:hypothetical protein
VSFTEALQSKIDQTQQSHPHQAAAAAPATVEQPKVQIPGPRSTNSLILFGIRKNCLISGRSLLLYQFTKRVIKLNNNYHGISLLSASYKILLGIISVDFDVKDQLVIRFSAFVRYWRKMGVHQLFIDFKKLVRFMKMCLDETYNKVHICKHLSESFPIQNCLKQDVLSPLLFNFAS